MTVAETLVGRGVVQMKDNTPARSIHEVPRFDAMKVQLSHPAFAECHHMFGIAIALPGAQVLRGTFADRKQK